MNLHCALSKTPSYPHSWAILIRQVCRYNFNELIKSTWYIIIKLIVIRFEFCNVATPMPPPVQISHHQWLHFPKSISPLHPDSQHASAAGHFLLLVCNPLSQCDGHGDDYLPFQLCSCNISVVSKQCREKAIHSLRCSNGRTVRLAAPFSNRSSTWLKPIHSSWSSDLSPLPP